MSEQTTLPLKEGMSTSEISDIVAGVGSVCVQETAEAVFRAGGNQLLHESAQQGLKAVADHVGQRGVQQLAEAVAAESLGEAAGAVVEQAIAGGAKLLARKGSEELAKKGCVELARQGGSKALAQAGTTAMAEAGKGVLRGVGAASGIGAVVDGVVASVAAVQAYQRDEMDGAQALGHVAKESVKGAIASGAGVLLTAGVVMLAGPLAPVAAFGIGVVGSMGTKALLNTWFGTGRAPAAS